MSKKKVLLCALIVAGGAALAYKNFVSRAHVDAAAHDVNVPEKEPTDDKNASASVDRPVDVVSTETDIVSDTSDNISDCDSDAHVSAE